MTNPFNLESIKEMLPNLSQAQLQELSSSIFGLLLDEKEPQEQEELTSTLICPTCGSTNCVRNGLVRGKQRFLCRDCKRTFGLTTGKVTAHSKLTRMKWERYIGCMIEGYSIRKSAEIVDVTVKTSFFMRHKILDALRALTDKTTVEGIVEMDETFLAESFKGNHSKSFFVLPRKPRKRGKQVSKRGISKEQICIATALDRNGKAVVKMICKGRATATSLVATYAQRIAEQSTICTNSFSAYSTVANKLNLVHKRIASGKHTNGLFNLAHINAFHSKFKGWMRKFCGVSTKHLPNYLAWFNWLEQNRDVKYDKISGKMMKNALGEDVDARIDLIRGRVADFVS